MKKLYESLLDNDEELFGDTGPKAIEESIKNFINDNYWLEREEDSIYIELVNEEYVVDIIGSIYANGHSGFGNKKLKSITNGLFKFREVTGNFFINNMDIDTLNGCPEKVGGDFNCSGCEKLKSLEGGPVEVKGYYDCNNCDSLKSLKGFPEEVLGWVSFKKCKNLASLTEIEKSIRHSSFTFPYFNFSDCTGLKSLKGLPKYIGSLDVPGCTGLKDLTGISSCSIKYLDVSGCTGLKNLKGAPKKIYNRFRCRNTNISYEEIVNYNIKGDKIY